MDALLPILFIAALVLNIRASFKLGLDWRGMLTTVRFVRDAYARRSALPTEEAEERAPHPAMGVSTGELVRRLRETLPPYQQKRLAHLVMPGPGRKAQQLNWALRPEALREILGEQYDPSRVFVGVSDADSIPDPDTYRWIAERELGGQENLAYQGLT